MTFARTFFDTCLAGTFGLALLPGAVRGDTMDCSRTQKLDHMLSTQVLNPFDRQERQLTQTSLVLVSSSKNPEWDGAKMTTYEHADSVGGAGTHMGYGSVTLKSGEKVWVKWEGAHHVVMKGDGSWELPFEGAVHFIGGTGKYKAIRGGGYYQGKNTADSVFQDIVCQAEY